MPAARSWLRHARQRAVAGTEGLFWTSLDVPSPRRSGASRNTPCASRGHPATSRFSVVAAGKPEHTLTVTVTERDQRRRSTASKSGSAPFHARTDKAGRAEIQRVQGRVPGSALAHRAYRSTHADQISGNASVELTMVHVPEEHPDARWVR